MSKINIEFDTVEKTLSVTLDGKPVSDVVEAYVSKRYYDKDEGFGCSVMTAKEDDASGITTMTRLVASESVEGRTLTRAGQALPTEHPDFITVETTSKLQQAIASCFVVKP